MTVAVQAKSTVLERSTPMLGAVELVLEDPQAAAAAKAGQFFQIAVEAPHTILRRPYSVAWVDPSQGRIGFIFNVVGAGSAWLASRHAGDELDLLGPLGEGFNVESGSRRAVCVAGGLGVATFPALVEELHRIGRPVVFLQGAGIAGRLLPAERLRGVDLRLATDDGSAGFRGSVVDLLTPELVLNADIFACGPTPMLRRLIDVAERFEMPLGRIQVALETPMGCGFGTCLGCVAPRSSGGYLLTCTDGPCVRADRIDWERMGDGFHG
jgi:dihydroorotate dehydrogenase electron transfer subunit